jgi:2-octaprenyl-6-methoxyphenol hydroxylase
MIHSKDIVISGGGVAGLVAATAFGDAGFDVLCVEPNSPIMEQSVKGADLRTTAYLQTAQDFLEKIGVWKHVKMHSAPLQIMRVADVGVKNLVTKDFDARDISDEPFGWNVGNWQMRAGLMERIGELPNVEIRTQITTTAVRTRSSEARIYLSDGHQISCKLLIAADGRDSEIRRHFKIPTRRTEFDQLALSFAVTHTQPHENISTEVHKIGGPFTLVPLPDHEGSPSSAAIWMDKATEIRARQILPVEDFNAAITERSGHVNGNLKLVTARSVWPIISQLSDRFDAERTALIGETAHVVPPIGAQGLNLSIGDIKLLINLWSTKKKNHDPTTLLANYSKQRRTIALGRILAIGALNRLSMADNSFLRLARSAGLSSLHQITPLRKNIMRLGLGRR